jgi:hypothetical protein
LIFNKVFYVLRNHCKVWPIAFILFTSTLTFSGDGVAVGQDAIELDAGHEPDQRPLVASRLPDDTLYRVFTFTSELDDVEMSHAELSIAIRPRTGVDDWPREASHTIIFQDFWRRGRDGEVQRIELPPTGIMVNAGRLHAVGPVTDEQAYLVDFVTFMAGTLIRTNEEEPAVDDDAAKVVFHTASSRVVVGVGRLNSMEERLWSIEFRAVEADAAAGHWAGKVIIERTSGLVEKAALKRVLDHPQGELSVMLEIDSVVNGEKERLD